MIAIMTRYMPASQRVKAYTTNGHQAYVAYDYGGTTEQVHFEAVKALCAKVGWSGNLIEGGLEKGFAWVWLDKDSQERYKWHVPGAPETAVNP